MKLTVMRSNVCIDIDTGESGARGPGGINLFSLCLRWAVSLHVLVGQTISLLKRMASGHAGVIFPIPRGTRFCFDLCGVRMNKGGFVGAAGLWVAVGLHRAALESLRWNFRKVLTQHIHAIDSDIRASIP